MANPQFYIFSAKLRSISISLLTQLHLGFWMDLRTLWMSTRPFVLPLDHRAHPTLAVAPFCPHHSIPRVGPLNLNSRYKNLSKRGCGEASQTLPLDWHVALNCATQCLPWGLFDATPPPPPPAPRGSHTPAWVSSPGCLFLLSAFLPQNYHTEGPFSICLISAPLLSLVSKGAVFRRIKREILKQC